MKLTETENTKSASFVVHYSDKYSKQKACLVDLSTGEITIGNDKLITPHFNPDVSVSKCTIEFRGKEFEVKTSLKDEKEISSLVNLERFKALASQPEPKNNYSNIKNPARAGDDWKIPRP